MLVFSKGVITNQTEAKRRKQLMQENKGSIQSYPKVKQKTLLGCKIQKKGLKLRLGTS